MPKVICSICLTLFLLTPQRNCDFRLPEKLRGFVEQQVQQYFPGAKAILLPRQHAIFVVTCTQGMGQQFVVKLMNYMATDRDMRAQLGTINYTGMLGYRYFILGFDSATILYDIQDETLTTKEISDDYTTNYRQTCGFQ